MCLFFSVLLSHVLRKYTVFGAFSNRYIKNNGDVFVQKSISRERPCYRATPVSGHARLLLLAVQDGVVWGVTEARNIVVRTGVTAGTEEGTDWKPVGK